MTIWSRQPTSPNHPNSRNMPIPLQRPSPEIPWVKLCGVRDLATARMLAALRPSAIGLNFYKPSSRFVDIEAARAIQAALPEEILSVGVFVNESTAGIVEICSRTGIQAIQLHGDEPPEQLAQLRIALPETSILRAWRVDETGLDSLAAYLEECETPPDAILIDAKVAGEYGGTGRTAPWEILRDYPASWPPMILAGGLHAENVAQAIATVRPFGVDTAGGIESSLGVKDADRAAAFVTAARLVRRDIRP